MVHVGVSGMATVVTLEQCSHNEGYNSPDVCLFYPDKECCVEGGPECLQSVIDMDTVCKKAAAAAMDVQLTVSTDAGRYLCDFSYYTSLQQTQGKSVFIHVPPLGKPYSAEQLGHALQTVINIILDMLKQSEIY
ncbi:pyroglutamyl-peptidase 1 isoform X2 [Hyperolius riggenbachi]